jgi:hypothetical protein
MAGEPGTGTLNTMLGEMTSRSETDIPWARLRSMEKNGHDSVPQTTKPPGGEVERPRCGELNRGELNRGELYSGELMPLLTGGI